jgi:hypothetical protein
LSHRALGTMECDESYSNDGATIFGRRGAGNSFTMSHTATRSSSLPYMDFNFCVTSVTGWGYAPMWEMGVYMALYGDAETPQVFREA